VSRFDKSPPEGKAPPDDKALYQQLLVVRSQLGDRSAIEELVGLWERRLLYYIRRLLSDEHDSQQVMQEVWVKVIAGIGSLHDPARLAPWLYSLTRFTVIDHLRDSYTRRQLLSALPADPIDGESAESFARFDDAEQVHYGLSQLAVVDREVLTLYFLDDLSVGGVAEVLQIPPGTVKSRLYHARKALSAVLAQRKGSQP
jgi:RNA polymerase sigma-70 factor (ECF subfamily)